MSSILLVINGKYSSPLAQAIQKEYNKLIKLVTPIAEKDRNSRIMESTGGYLASVNDLIAYQIGWGTLLLSWYNAGLDNQKPQMPGDGFTKWDYTPIAHHFYDKYGFKNTDDQAKLFFSVVKQILDFVEKEYKLDHLDKTGVWGWCTLSSGTMWPLSKWVTVNTASPYKSAYSLIKKTFKNK